MTEKGSLQRVNLVLLCGVLICVVLFYAREILVPIFFSVFFAMLFAGLSNRMERAGMKRIFSAIISILLLMMTTAAICLLLVVQSQRLAEKSSDIRQKMEQLKKQAQRYVSDKLHIPVEKQDALISKRLKSFIDTSGDLVKNVVAGIANLLGSFVLVLVFTFLFLYQREKYEAFFLRVFGDRQNPDETRKVMAHISDVSQKYLVGRLLSVTIFTALFTVGNLIIGLQGAFLVAFASALMTIVPYVGSILGGCFSFAVALVTADTQVAVGALGVVLIVQTIDNYFIEPYIIGGQVHISGFFTILILLVGGVIWGVAGMVLFLPMLGVTKIIFDVVPSLKPYGFLIGDQEKQGPSKKILNKLKRLFAGTHLRNTF